MISRREWLRRTALAGAALGVDPRLLDALTTQEVLTRAIPSSGERLPVIGLGTAATFSGAARSEEVNELGEVLRTLVEHGGSVLDTAPSYGRGASEDVTGRLAEEMGIADRIFWATKVNVAGRGGGEADPAEAMRQIENSFEQLRVPTIDLIQVHNLGDPPTQLGILKELKAEGRIRYLGITTTSKRGYERLAAIMRSEPLDFIGIDYAVDNRSAAEEIFPIAREEGIGVLVYLPFGRSRLWSRVEGREVPEWAADFGANTWAQFFLKYVVAHPDVTAATPATSDPEHMLDNIQAAYGRLPDEDERARMEALVDGLPEAAGRG